MNTINEQSLKLAVIDDDSSLCILCEEFFKSKGYLVDSFLNGKDALQALDDSYSLVFCDLKLPDKSGIEILDEVNKRDLEFPIIFITAHESIESAAKAMKKGAFDYIYKPLNFTELEVIIGRALKQKELEKKYVQLKAEVEKSKESGLIGISKKMKQLFELVDRVAHSNSNILINGESGSGKEVVARSIHEKSQRAQNKFVAINCSAIPTELLESELFGHKKGSFTGAGDTRIGLFEEADGGTLFLDEIGDMPLQLQSKVLRAIQERKIRKVGDNKDQEINVRIIAATHKDLKQAIKNKEFREDLYYRLCVIPLFVPSLRDRVQDIPILAVHFMKKYAALNHKNLEGFTRDAITKLKRYSWPGNVRELENTVERAIVLSMGKLIHEEDISIEGYTEVDSEVEGLFSGLISLRELEKLYIEYVLSKTEGKKERSAEILGINRKTLYRKEKEYGIYFH
ncbi:MAG: sigma-54-dependent Fis family transcriptional regulator [Halobacteriovoraceae bacterium]|nr:sigma-54-dependent Fis family transcriptional regulator [Halobacteriovoraceae bacterium]MCB9095520.1 sigma-54-dependent Fis family transcriptional regulator [Halobacteriovoraceae bacterium]